MLHWSVDHGRRCHLEATAGVRLPTAWDPCPTGVRQVVARVAPNTAAEPRRLHVTAWAEGAGGAAVAAVAFLLEGPRSPRTTPAPAASGTPSSSAPVAGVPPVPLGSASAPSSPTEPLRLVTADLAPATEGVRYLATLSAAGGTPPYSFSLTAGALPVGLSLAVDGVVSGVPATVGSATVTISVTDASTPTRQSASATLTLRVGAPPFVGQASTNWSGYVASSPGPPITEAGGEWTVPNLDCTATPNAGVATWVGIGGASVGTGSSSGVLLQTGVSADCVDGLQQDTPWWEEYPSQPNNEVDFSGLPVAPGDLVRASVYEAAGGAWVTRLDDLTSHLSGVMVTGTGWGVSLDGTSTFSAEGSTAGLSYAGGTSAEWIAEDYQQSGALVPLAAFGTLSFQSLTTSLASWSLVASDAVEMVQASTVLALPSPPGADGFSIADTLAAPSAPG